MIPETAEAKRKKAILCLITELAAIERKLIYGQLGCSQKMQIDDDRVIGPGEAEESSSGTEGGKRLQKPHLSVQSHSRSKLIRPNRMD